MNPHRTRCDGGTACWPCCSGQAHRWLGNADFLATRTGLISKSNTRELGANIQGCSANATGLRVIAQLYCAASIPAKMSGFDIS